MSAEKKSSWPALLVVLALLAPVIFFSRWGGSEQSRAGEAVKPLTSFTVEGTWPEMTNRVVLLDFWASWCGPCRRSLPVINELHRTYKDRGLVVVGVNLDDSAADMKEYLQKNPLDFPQVRDVHGQLAQVFDASAIPRTVIIGKDLKIVGTHTGFDPSRSKGEYVKEIEAALKQP